MKNYISALYIKEKMFPIERLISNVETAIDNKTDDMSDMMSDNLNNEIAFSFAVIAKELGVKIPDV
ncbi:MAG: hypothetical protein IJZ36_03630 [Bacilli bacterium]|nr:hypothetical protein [Bacilli bacterium]